MRDTANFFDARAAAWDANPMRRKLARDIVAAMDAAGVFCPEAEVLDFGCGTGLLSLGLAARTRSVTGLDTSAGMLAELSAKIERAGLAGVGTLLADLAAGDPLPGQYDVVASAMALHHVADLDRVLPRLFAATKPGGRLALADLDSEGGRFHDDNAAMQVQHFGFDRERLAADLARIGWTEICARTAATIEKPSPSGAAQTFTVFLMTGRKP